MMPSDHLEPESGPGPASAAPRNEAGAAAAGGTGPSALHALPGRLAALAASTGSRPRFLREVLRAAAEAVGAPYAILHARSGAEIIDEDWHQGPGDPAFWRPSAQTLMNEVLAGHRPRARLYRGRRDGRGIALVGAPFPDPAGGTLGAVVLVVPEPDDARITALVGEFGRTLGVAAFLLGRVGSAGGADSAPDRATVEAMEFGGASGNRRQLAFALANGLRARTGTEMVAVGAVEGDRVRLLSISGFDTVPARSPGAQCIAAALEEGLDAGRVIVQQPSETWNDETTSSRFRLHEAWHVAAGRAAVMSIPLRADGEVVAMVGVRARPGAAISSDERERIERSLVPYGLLVRTVARAERSWLRHGWDAGRRWIDELSGPRSLVRRVVIAAILVGGPAWLALAQLPLTLSASATVVPLVQRHVTVPFDGALVEILVQDGEEVRAGQLLARLRTDDLEIEASRLAAAIEVQNLEGRRRLSAGDLPGSRLAEAEARALAGERDLVQLRLGRAEVRSPIDGRIVASEHEAGLGRTVTRGETLFSVAGDEGWALELDMREADASLVAAGMTGRFAPTARPDAPRELVLTRTASSATVREGGNVFVAEAELEDPPAWTRAGMEGVARIDGGDRPAWWVLGRRTIAWVRRTLWL